MAGQPKTHQVRKALAARAARELGEGSSLWEYALLWMSSGRTLLDLARSLGSPTFQRTEAGQVMFNPATGQAIELRPAEVPDGVSRETVRRIVVERGEEVLAGAEGGGRRAVEQALAHARQIGASGLAEEAGAILDDVREDRDAIAKAKARSEFRVWLASRWNREEYDAKAPQTLVVNAGTLHLTALRERAAMRAAGALTAGVASATPQVESTSQVSDGQGDSPVTGAIEVDYEVIETPDPSIAQLL